VVDEESIISEKSPILTGQYVKRTVESNVFRLLLTGVDDSSVVEGTEPRLVRSRQEAKIEVIGQLRTAVEDQIAEKSINTSVAELREQLARVEGLFASASEQLAAEQATLSALEQRRRDAWASVRRIDSRLNVFSELQDRFMLLEEQYTSDLRRLDSIAEAGVRLSQLREERCPASRRRAPES
jgi:predicted nuclease with TOPRIM domain